MNSWDKSIDKLDKRIGNVEDAINNIITDPEREETDAKKEAKFARYRLARAKKTNGHGDKTYEDVWDRITKEELDYYLKKQLDVPPEQRYQYRKEHWYFHDSSWSMRGLDEHGYDGQGCNQFTGCVPECRYYPETGRIEDEEIINQYRQQIEERRKAGTLIEGAEKDELVRKIKFNL